MVDYDVVGIRIGLSAVRPYITAWCAGPATCAPPRGRARRTWRWGFPQRWWTRAWRARSRQGLTLVDVGAQLEQLQGTFMIMR